LKGLLNPFRYGVLSWQYFSHKVLRWTLAPVSLFLIFPVNWLIVYQQNGWLELGFYTVVFYIQLLCYILAGTGWYYENRKLRFKLLFVPYYFASINYAAIRGIFRYLNGTQSVKWEKAKRAGQ